MMRFNEWWQVPIFIILVPIVAVGDILWGLVHLARHRGCSHTWRCHHPSWHGCVCDNKPVVES